MPERITRTDQEDEYAATGMPAIVFADTPEFTAHIENQETQGQRELIESEDLPTDTDDNDQAFVDLGFTFGEPHKNDPLFRPATLPDGWRREASDHSMHSYIVDDKGRSRVNIFYKAAYYDRRADMRLLSPTHRLMNAVWGDEEPTGLDLDELLTADLAMAYLRAERETFAKRVELYRGRNEYSDALARAEMHLARVNKLISFLPDTHGHEVEGTVLR